MQLHLRGRWRARNRLRDSCATLLASGSRQRSSSSLNEFKAWLDREHDDRRILSKSPIHEAFTYTLNQWGALCRYTKEGYLSFDNNVAARLVKIPAIRRKNYLFVGSESGGRGAAAMYSLTEQRQS